MLIPIKEVLTVEASKPYTQPEFDNDDDDDEDDDDYDYDDGDNETTNNDDDYDDGDDEDEEYEGSMDGARSVTLHSPSLPGPHLQEGANVLKKIWIIKKGENINTRQIKALRKTVPKM